MVQISGNKTITKSVICRQPPSTTRVSGGGAWVDPGDIFPLSPTMPHAKFDISTSNQTTKMPRILVGSLNNTEQALKV